MEIRKERGFPQQLEKSLAKDARLFHSSHRPNNKDLSIIYCRQRSTLRRLQFGPKDGEHLIVRIISFSSSLRLAKRQNNSMGKRWLAQSGTWSVLLRRLPRNYSSKHRSQRLHCFSGTPWADRG
jgi:hypothetical protein